MKAMFNDPPIRILHILGKMNSGGVESMIMSYYRHINKERIQFDFIVDNDSKHVPLDEIESLGGRIYYVPPYQQLNKYKKELKEILSENSYSIVHSHINSLSIFSLSAAKKANIPIRIAHSHSTSAPGETKKNIFKYALRPFSKLYPTHFCSCSLSAGEWLFGNKISKNNKLMIINNGIDMLKFQFNEVDREMIRRKLGITKKFVIGHTGRLNFQKNQEFLLYLLQNVLTKEPDTILLLIGEGPDKSKLQKLAEELNIKDKVIFTGSIEDVHRHYNAMDLFVFPSRYEGFGISAIEAQVSGMPVILSDRVPDEACLTENCKILSLNESIETWAKEISLVKKEGQRALNVMIDDFDITVNVCQLEDYYFRLMHESR